MDSFYSTPAWLDLRARVLDRDGHSCTVSRLLGGECSGSLHVHHIYSRRERPDLALDEDNCGSACGRHHRVWEAVRAFIRRARGNLPTSPVERAATLIRNGAWHYDDATLDRELDHVGVEPDDRGDLFALANELRERHTVAA